MFLLKELDNNSGNGYLEDNIIEAIDEVSECDYLDLRRNAEYAINELNNINSVDELIVWLEQLPAIFGEAQCEREIARSEEIGDYIYENGYY